MQVKGFAAMGFADVAEAMERGHEAAGCSTAMREAAEALVGRRQVHHFSALWIALQFTFADEKEATFQWLEKAVEEGDPFLAFARVAPYWDSLRSDSRFQEILRRMNFPE